VLIQFRVENHRSLRDEQTLSLVASSTGPADDPCLLHPKGLNEALLPAVALYGANASGKTNVLLALEFMARAVLDSHRLWEPEAAVPRQSFSLSDQQDAPSLYETDMLIENVRYRYGFIVDSDRIVEEWLYAWPAARRQTRFIRDGDQFEFSRNFGGDNEVIRGLTRPNSLFLSAAAQNNQTSSLRIFRWFLGLSFEISRATSSALRQSILGSRPFRQLFDEAVLYQPSLFDDDLPALREDRDRVIQLLRIADTGIVDLRVEPGGIDSVDGRRSRRPRLLFQHKTEDLDRAWLPLEAESAGTITLLEVATRLVPILRTGGVLCVDELEASLHPMLAGALLRLFCDPKQNPNGAQLIFTTHDTNLLGTMPGFKPLRRDQIWLTEKDEAGATHLYPLTDFHPRKHENLERGYLQGRYGAVPFLGEFLDDAASELA
jgi:uncharacterized protein